MVAFASTPPWTSYLEDERRFAAQLNWRPPSYVAEITRQMKELDAVLRCFTRPLIPEHLFRSPISAPPVQAALLGVPSLGLLPRVDASADLAKIVTRNMVHFLARTRVSHLTGHRVANAIAAIQRDK